LRARIRAILLALEERERENVFRMKRFKGRKR
jgi:vacuolar-type H+-ATPase subunit D/Vma8